jgi:hypothetical protein
LTSPVVAAVLDDAAGILDSACRVGGRYSLADLANMSGSGHSLLVRLSCDIAYSLLVARRGYSAADMKSMAPQMDWVNSMLDNLRKGDRVLDIFGHAVTPGGDAGSGDASPPHTALTCPHIETLRMRTPGYHSGTDNVGLSSRLWGRRNPN